MNTSLKALYTAGLPGNNKGVKMKSALSDLELKVMSIVWHHGGKTTAKQIYTEMHAEFGYTRGAVYALIHRCIEKGAMERNDPNFTCKSIVNPDSVRYDEIAKLVNTAFDGSATKLVKLLLDNGNLSAEDLDEIQAALDARKK